MAGLALTMCMLGIFSCFIVVCCFFLVFFFKIVFFVKILLRVTNSLDPNRARRFVGPDLGPNCLRRSSADNTSGQKVNKIRMTDDDETPNTQALRLHQITCGTPKMHL